ncbi:unnamed protein product [Rangifer tarandus platyrhynchus]|uniref:Uncharacterized protein n=2 Tax=Rangifer tarandus platyrhynchus TaxID=3082113 RepID=A0ABN8ZQ72_RANTA|nr:unnamed protein product [Rangifer tarandus platyrhynchus]CAI9709715.1 unnamed protein product [Rangifer tarandus platyrhynchus]
MGTYLGRPCPSPPPRALGGQHLPGRLGCPQPDPRPRRFSVAGPGHPAVRAPLSTRRPAHKYPVTLHLRFVRASLRWCCMIPQALRSFLGVLTSLCGRHHQRKAVLGARISTMCRGSASAVGTVPGCGGRQQQVTPVPPTTLRCAPGSCTEKTVRSALGESGKGLAQQEGDPAFRQKDHQKGGPDGSRGARSTFRPFGARGDFSAFVPRPGPLRRNLHAESSVDTSAEKLQTSCVSSCPQRNAITSSHSSTRGFPPGQRRTGPRMPRGLPRRSSRKASDGGPAPPCAAPVASQSNSRPEDAEASRGQKRTWENGPPTSDSPRPGKRRFPLLPRRRGEPLRLPAPPELGFRVTAEDLDAEKAAALRRINSALRDETPSPQPYRTFPAPADPPVPGRAPRPERGQRESASPAPVDARESAGGAPAAHPWSGGRHGSSRPLSPRSQPLPGPPSHSRPPGPFTLPTQASSPGSGSASLNARPPSPSAPASAPATGTAGARGSPAPAWAPGSAWLPGFQRPVRGPLRSAAGGGGLCQPPAWGPAAEDATQAFPAAPGSSGLGSPTPMCLDSPVFTRHSPPPVSDPQSLLPIGQLISQLIGFSLQTRPSPCTSGGLTPHPASDTQVTPMDTSPPSPSPLFGSPPGSSRSLFPSSQALQTPPRDSAASATVSTSLPGLRFSCSSHTRAPAQPTSGVPDVQQRRAPAWGHSPHCGNPAAPALTGNPTSAPGPPAPPTNSPMGTRASTQPASAAFPAGPAPAAATCVPQAVPSAGPRSGPRCPAVGGSRTAPCRPGGSAAPRGVGSGASVLDVSCLFAALSLSTQRRGARRTTHSRAGRVAQNTGAFLARAPPW